MLLALVFGKIGPEFREGARMQAVVLKDVWDILIDPAWITFGLTFLIGGLGLLALLLLYPMSRD